MKIEQNDVELVAFKTKSLQDLDNETCNNSNAAKVNDTKQFKTNNNNNSKLNDKASEFLNETEDQEEEDDFDSDHYESSVRFVKIDKSPNGACGFHLTRSKWDPYPWVSAVDNFTPAAKSDLKAGDCVLEVNGCDILGLRITEIAKLVKSSQHQVTLLLWSTSCNTKCDEESLCAAPMPRSLQRLSLVVQTVLSLIECPVCLDTITPPAMQCQNGHLLCVNCRIRAEKCPVCRDRYFPRPALIAEQIQSAITSAFSLCRNEDKVRQKIFGRHNRQRQMVKTTLESLQQKQQQQQQQQLEVHKSLTADTQQHVHEKTLDAKTTTTTTTINRKCDRKVTDKFFKCSSGNRTTCNKFLAKLLNSKAYSLENLTNGHNNNTTTTTTTRHNNNFNTCHTTITSAISQPQLSAMQQQAHSSHKHEGEHQATQQQTSAPLSSSVTNTNQFNDFPRNVARNHHYLLTNKPNLNSIENDLNINSKLCCKQMSSNKLKHFSISSNTDLTRTKESITCILESPSLFMNGSNKRPCAPAACETSYATIARGIKVREKHFIQRNMCQNDVQATNQDTSSVLATNFLKSHSSSMTSLNLSLKMSSSATPSTCCCSYCYSCSASSSSSVTQNCQSSLSASTSSQ